MNGHENLTLRLCERVKISLRLGKEKKHDIKRAACNLRVIGAKNPDACDVF